MPVANTQPVYPPVSQTPIASVWGQAVSDHVVQKFTSVADRDAKWTNPPQGARCWIPMTDAVGGRPRGLLFVYEGTSWWPHGLALYLTKATEFVFPVDATFWGIPYDFTHVRMGSLSGATWTSPAGVNGLAEITMAATLIIALYQQGDYHFDIGPFTGGTQYTVGSSVGKFSSIREHGSILLNLGPGATIEPRGYVAGAAGLQKRIYPHNGLGFMIKYLGRRTDV